MQTMQFVDGPEECRACRYFGELPGEGSGACRRRAPVVTTSNQPTLRGWPAVHEDDTCGDFERRLVPFTPAAWPPMPPAAPPMPAMPAMPVMPSGPAEELA